MLDVPRRAETSEKTGYPVVTCSVNQRRVYVAAHRIVWMIANHADIPDGMEINHLDGNRSNHHPRNLEIVTRQENTAHAFRCLPRKKKAQRGEMNAGAKITAEDVSQIRQLWATGAVTQREIGERFGIKQSTVSCIVRRDTWTHVP